MTAFTIGHSVTLGLASLGWVALPAPPVEACIELSIVFLANEAISGNSTDHGYLITAGFGLLHGLGFASAIKAIGVGRADILLSLFAFNIGVEIGQILFVAAATSLFFALKRVSLPLPLVQ